MSVEALAIAESIRAARKNRPHASSANILCAICGNPISAKNCRPFNQTYGAFIPAILRPQMAERKPAELFPLGHFIEDELKERGWSRSDLVQRIGGRMDIVRLEIDLLIDAPTKGVVLDGLMAEDLARVFGTSADLWLSLDAGWQQQQQ